MIDNGQGKRQDNTEGNAASLCYDHVVIMMSWPYRRNKKPLPYLAREQLLYVSEAVCKSIRLLCSLYETSYSIRNYPDT